MIETHEGGCLCRAVRYRTVGAPNGASACHCTFCQRSTGTAMRAHLVFSKESVEFVGEPPAFYDHRSEDHGRILTVQFCRHCGTSIGVLAKRFPTTQCLSIGTFDERDWFKIGAHLFVRSAVDWVAFPSKLPCFMRHRITEDGGLEDPLPTQSKAWMKSELRL